MGALAATPSSPTSHAHSAWPLACELDERQPFPHDRIQGLLITDWSHDDWGYYRGQEPLARWLEVAQTQAWPCVYPTHSDGQLAFAATHTAARITYRLAPTPTYTDITFSPGEVHLRSLAGTIQAQAIAAAVAWQHLAARRTLPQACDALRNQAQLRLAGWYRHDHSGRVVHDVRMHPVNLAQNIADLHHAWGQAPNLLIRPYPATWHLYPTERWSTLFQQCRSLWLLPPYPGSSPEDIAPALKAAAQASGRPTFWPSALHQVDLSAGTWLCVGGEDIGGVLP